MTRYDVYSEDVLFVRTRLNGDLTTVQVWDRETGLEGKGHARRMLTDIYDEALGVNIAYSRAVQRLLNKNIRWYSRQAKSVRA